MKRDNFIAEADASRHWEKRTNQIEPYYTILTKLKGDLAGNTLLDVGCAAGIETKLFSDKGLSAEGVDINEELIDEASRKFPELNFRVGNAEVLPYQDSSFDIVFSINTLFYTDIEKSLKEFLRVVKSDGICILSFDLQIINLDENKVFHTEDLDHLEKVVSQNNGEIIFLGEEQSREDSEPFKHEHTFRIVAMKKLS